MTDHRAYEQMRLVVEALCTGTEGIHTRLLAAEPSFRRIDNSAEPGSGQSNLYHRIASSLVEGGDESGTIADSITALDEARAVDIARDMLTFFELLAGILDEDSPWPSRHD